MAEYIIQNVAIGFVVLVVAVGISLCLSARDRDDFERELMEDAEWIRSQK